MPAPVPLVFGKQLQLLHPARHAPWLQSEVVVAVVAPGGRLLAVLDVDSGALRPGARAERAVVA